MGYTDIVHGFRGKRILIIGDLILDRYIYGKVRRISPEAPVPVVEVTGESFLPWRRRQCGEQHRGPRRQGLSCRRCRKGHSRDGLPGTAAGKGDRGVRHHRGQAPHDGQDKDPRPQPAGRPVRQGRHEKGRGKEPLPAPRLPPRGCSRPRRRDRLGLQERRHFVDAHQVPRPVLLRQRDLHRRRSQGGPFPFLQKRLPHHAEYPRGLPGAGVEIRDEKSLLKAGRTLLTRLHCRSILVTRGEDGMSLFTRGEASRGTEVIHIPTAAQKVFDVTGAGDTVIATFTLAHAAGASLEEAAVIANHSAGIVVGEVGTAVSTPGQLLKSLAGRVNRGMAKAIALYSGGLDSILAILTVLKQGVSVSAPTFLTRIGWRCLC
ncbi:MAG: PfkB family carbohydrate kinase [Ignavibacteriales bacterium]|nr:PfkB family carbohydrate kinase [Ignavibacteriales bacterium]